jgi:hypothetical protein
MWQYFDTRARRLGILDTKLAQAAAIFFALTLVKAYPAIMDLSIWFYAGVAAACAIRPLLTFYRGDEPQ